MRTHHLLITPRALILGAVVILSTMSAFASGEYAVAGPAAFAVPHSPLTTERVSVSNRELQANNASLAPKLSYDGRYVAFTSDASDLVNKDTNLVTDVFVRDRQKGTTSRVSVSSRGEQGNKASFAEAISADGRYVVFTSQATNFAPTSNGEANVFVHDRRTKETSLVSVSSEGVEGNQLSSWAGISADGRYVAFSSFATNLVPGDMNAVEDVFVHDRLLRTTRLVSESSAHQQANSYSLAPSLSADGRYVAFKSFADNLVPADINSSSDVFVRDTLMETTQLVSVSLSGSPGNADSATPIINADGSLIVFDSFASDLVPNDTNNVGDVFIRDLALATTTRVSVSTDGTQGNHASGGQGFLITSVISASGQFVAFTSKAANLVPDDTNEADDVFVHDRFAATTSRVSLSATGQQLQGDPQVDTLAISGDSKQVAFSSSAVNLVPNDTNAVEDVFVREG